MDFYTEQVRKAKEHHSYRHYTTVKSLLAILDSKSLQLSDLEKLNDPAEEERTIAVLKHKHFVISFCHSGKESIPMWRTYGQDENGVCLEFRSLDFACSKEKYRWDSQDVEKKWEIRVATPIDVIYTGDPHEYVEQGEVQNGESTTSPICMAYLKTSVWDYEQETRVVARVDVSNGTRSTIMSFNHRTNLMDKEYTYPDFRHIYLDLNNIAIKEMSIIFNPFMCDAIKEVIKTGIKDRYPFITDGQFRDSELVGKIRLK